VADGGAKAEGLRKPVRARQADRKAEEGAKTAEGEATEVAHKMRPSFGHDAVLMWHSAKEAVSPTKMVAPE
jgi:hypothetical protein